MPTPQPPEQQSSGIPILFLRCTACRRQPVTFMGVRLGSMVLSCEHCGLQWTRADRRGGLERRQTQQVVPQERRTAERRNRPPMPPSLQCPECWRHSVTVMEVRLGSMVLACDHCRHQWTRGDRRAGLERRHEQRPVPRERREAERRTRVPASIARVRRPGVPGWSLDIKGEMSLQDDLVVEGDVTGSISMPGHTLTVGVDAQVAAVVAARNVIVRGSFTGRIVATERIAIEASARMNADLVSPVLVVVEGAEFTGRVHKPGELVLPTMAGVRDR